MKPKLPEDVQQRFVDALDAAFKDAGLDLNDTENIKFVIWQTVCIAARLGVPYDDLVDLAEGAVRHVKKHPKGDYSQAVH